MQTFDALNYYTPSLPTAHAPLKLYVAKANAISTKANVIWINTNVISTEAAQLHRAAQRRDPCISSLSLPYIPQKSYVKLSTTSSA
ncbi:MAG: hypothetical protein BGO25_15995 [Acidobacteriales bacterium 59-55]|nr:MAG: hypothetical protein BGO25_15995 [Acidobacteriales bacterium 59-55]